MQPARAGQREPAAAPARSAAAAGTLLVALLLLLPVPAVAQTFLLDTTAGISDTFDGQGVAWGDYDGDSDLDVYVSNLSSHQDLLYRNDGGVFTRIDTTAGIVDARSGVGAAWADYDNDGDLDLFVANFSSTQDWLWRNSGGGTFTDIATVVGMTDALSGDGAAWADYDGDGDLDLFVANGSTHADLLYRNAAGAGFTNVAVSAGVSDASNGEGVAWGYLDDDARIDLFVVNTNGQQDRFYHNNGDGTFTDVAATRGLTDADSGVGTAIGDYDNDGDLDLFVANKGTGQDRLWRNDGAGNFLDATVSAGLSDTASGFGPCWGDYDNDGDLDLFVANFSSQQDFLYRNDGGVFVRVDTSVGLIDTVSGIGCAWADYDNDGDLDLFVANTTNTQDYLWRNGGNANSWIKVIALTDTNGNAAEADVDPDRLALGAWVEVDLNGGADFVSGAGAYVSMLVGAGHGYGQNAIPVHLGVGGAATVDVRVRFPDGSETTVVGVAANQTVTVRDPGPVSSLGPNIWYVNDTSTAGDSFTSAIGSVWHDGLSPSTPKRSLNDLEGLLTPGDTIYVDSGFFYEPDTFTIDTDGVFVIGVDSASTVIDFDDTTGAEARAIYAQTETGIVLRSFRVTDGHRGIVFDDVDSALIDGVHVDGHGEHGIVLANGSSGNSLDSVVSTGNGGNGLLFSSVSGNSVTGGWVDSNVAFGIQLAASSGNSFSEIRLRGNIAEAFVLSTSGGNSYTDNIVEDNFSTAFSVSSSSDGNRFERNTLRNNLGQGFYLGSSANNYFAQNTVDSNAEWAVYFDVGSSGDTFAKNLILPSPYRPDSGVLNVTTNAFDFTRNWFGSTDSTVIRGVIMGAGADSITYGPWRLGIVDTAAGADTVAPNAPDTLAATAFSDTMIRLDWAPSVGSEEPEAAPGQMRYYVYRSPVADTSLWLRAGTVGFGTNSFDDTGLSPVTTYYYRVTVADAWTPENESFFSDSEASATTANPSPGPNVWYVNDTSTIGDSWATFVGADTQSGLTPAAPKRTLNALEGLLTPGDTVYVDSGFFYEPDTVTIDTDSIWILGVDSAATRIVFTSASPTADRSIYASGRVRHAYRDLRLENAYHGVWWNDVDTSAIERLSVPSAAQAGIYVASGSAWNTIDTVEARGCAYGIYLSSAPENTVRGSLLRDAFLYGIRAGGNSNVIEGNTVEGAGAAGVRIISSANRILRNTVRNGAALGFEVVGAGNIFEQNTADSNLSWAFFLDSTASSCTFAKNVFAPSPYVPDSGVYNNAPNAFDFRRNWWATTDSSAIRSRIKPDTSADSIVYIPFRLGIVDTAPNADTVAPRAPDTVAATPLDTSSIRVSWAAVTLNEEPSPNPVNLAGYRVYRMATANTSLALSTINVGPTTTTVDDTGLAPGTYFYRVTSVDSTTPYENQSFFSDSVPSATAGDTSGPNVWYVNDTSVIGDSFTTAFGNDSNSGISPDSPFRTLNRLEGLLTPGDTILVDSGFFYEADTFTIDTNGVYLIGVDSRSTVIDFTNYTRSIYLTGVSRLTFRDLRVTRGFDGFNLDGGVETSTFTRLAVDSNARNGFILSGGAGNLFESCAIDSNASNGVYAAGSAYCTFAGTVFRWNGVAGLQIFGAETNAVSGCRSTGNAGTGFGLTSAAAANALMSNVAEGNGGDGFEIITTSDRNALRGNVSRNNAGAGFLVNGSSGNLLSQNTADSNGDWAFFLGAAAAADTLEKNVFIGAPGRPDSGLLVDTTYAFDVRRNWWGTTDSVVIRGRIFGAGADSIQYIPFRLGTVDTAPGADTVAPRAPDTVAATALGSSSIRVSWAAVTLNEEPSPNPVNLAGYRVYRMANANTSLAQATIVVGATQTTVDDTGLGAGETWFYRVTAFDDLAFAAYENQSYFSDSVPSATTSGDTSGPNVWYVNDTSLAGDSFTTALGADTQNGLNPSTPKRTLNALEGLLTPGDTILVDSGTYWEADTFTIDTNGVYLIGVDSSATVIDFNDMTAAGARAIYATGRQWLTIRDLRVTDGWNGIWLDNVDTSTIERVRADSHGSYGFYLSSGSDSNTLRSNLADSNASVGIYLFASDGNLLESNTARANSGFGFILYSGSDTNTLRSNLATSNVQAGIMIDGSTGNNIHQNECTGNDTGVRIIGAASGNTVAKNILWPNDVLAIWNQNGAVLSIARNWYGTTDSGAIDARVADTVNAFVPYRLGIVDTAAGADTVAPRAPDTVVAAALSETEIRISWAVTVASEEAEGTLGLVGYNVYRATSPTASTWTWIGLSPAGTETFVDSGLSVGTTYYWRVTALDGAAYTNEAFFSDSIAAGTPYDSTPPVAFARLSPADGYETSGTVGPLVWTASTDTGLGLDSYTVQVSTSQAFVPTVVDTQVAATETTVLLSLAGSETYFWRVIAKDLAGNTTASGPTADSSFVVDTLAPTAFSLVSPLNGANTSAANVFLDWTDATDSHAGLPGYQVLVATNPGFSPAVFWETIVPAVSETSVALAPETYYWIVYAGDDVGNTAAASNAPGTFVVTPGDTTPPAPFNRLSPADGFETSGTTITLVWAASTDTSGIDTYTVRIATAPSFAAMVVDTDLDGTDTDLVVSLAGSETYWWRVIATDGAGNTTLAGPTFDSTFIVDTTAPTAFALTAPAEGTETGQTTIAFTWTTSSDALSGLNRYRFLLSTSSAFTTLTADSSTGLVANTTIVVQANDTYYWRVWAYDDAGNTTVAGDSLLVVDTTAPTAFALVSPVGGATVGSPVTLDWNASTDTLTGINGYALEVATNATFTPVSLSGFQAAPDTTLTLTPDTYWWRVTTSDDAGNTIFSTPIVESFIVLADTIPPDTPTGFVAVPGDAKVTLLWAADTTSDVVRNLLHRAPAAGGPYTQIATIDSPTTSYVDSGLANGTTYWYRLQAEDSGGLTSDSTAAISATPFGETPAAPTGVAAAGGDGYVTVTWTPSGEIDVLGYRIERSDTSGGPYALVGTATPRTASSFVDTSVVNGTTYYYVVRAYDGDGYVSAYSAEVAATPGAPDTQPPTITHTPVSAATAGETVVVSGQASDDVGITGAKIVYKRSGEAVWQSVDWSPQAPPAFSGSIPAESVTVAGLDYYLFARDAAGNTVTHGDTSNPHHVIVTGTDSAAPVILHTPDSGASQGGTMTVTATITDSSPPLTVLLKWRAPGESIYQSASMANVGGDTWQGTIPADSVQPPQVEYRIEACDVRSNCAASPSTGDHAVTVNPGDVVAPTISHTPITTAAVGSNVSILATVTDDSALDPTRITLHYKQDTPGAVFESSPMTLVSGDDWAGTIPASVLSVPDTDYRYYIEAYDSAGNVARKPDTTGYPLRTTASDTSEPVLTHTPVPTALVGETITIRVTATDDSAGVAAVVLYWRVTGETWTADTLPFVGGNDWEDSIPGDSVTTQGIEYYIEAFDSAVPPNGPALANGKDSATPHVVVVVLPDSTPPTITHTPETEAVMNQAKTITADVADDRAVASVVLSYRRVTDTSYVSVSMTLVSAPTYQATVPATYVPDTNGFSYFIVATDASGNTAQTGTLDTSLAGPNDTTAHHVAGIAGDSNPPTLVHTPVERATAGESTTFTAQATDDVGVASATLYFRTPGSAAYSSLVMSLVAGSTYEVVLDGSYLTTSNLEYYVEALDASGNVARSTDTTAPHFVRVVAVPVDLTRARTFPNPWIASAGEPLCLTNLPADPSMTIEVFDRAGRKVDEMAVGRGIEVMPSWNEACWGVTTSSGRPVASGVYHLVIRSRYGTRVLRATIIR